MTEFSTFENTYPPTIEQIGGKGFSLFYARKEGFNVPPAMILPTIFFRPWMEQLKSSPQWEAYTQAADDELPAAAKVLKESCGTLMFSEEQQQELVKIHNFLRDENITLMAVRSSSPEEDMEGASFAGIYETLLGVPLEELETAVKNCFASALDERVAAYKKEHGYDPYDPKIAVIIQKQINAEVSGVAFSLNPLNNSFDQCVINANFGLGETVVDGSVTPDQWVVDKVTQKFLERKPGEKSNAVYIKAGGGSETKTPEPSQDICLDDIQALAVMNLASKVERLYGKPVDIEWTFGEGELFLLQARPITTYYRLPDEMVTLPGEQKNLYHDANLSEQGLPENLSPLGDDLSIYFSKFMIPGNPAEDFFSIENGLAFSCKGRMYTHLGRMVKLLGKKSATKSYQLVDKLGTQIMESLDWKEYIPKKLPKGFLKNFIKTGLGALIYVKPVMRANRKPDEYLQHYINENARLRQWLQIEFESGSSFDDFYKKSCTAVGAHMNEVQLPALMASEPARGKLRKAFKNESESIQKHLRSIEQSFPNNVTIEMGLLLYGLSQLPDVKQINSAQEFVSKLESGQLSAEFTEKWQLFIKDYGFRGPKELDAATPRYYEKTEEIFTLLKTMENNNDPELSPQKLFDQGAKQRVESVQFLEDFLARKSRRKLKAFKKNYKLLENFAAYRENPKYFMIIVVDYLRRRILEQAKQWVASGRLDSADQVFDLHLGEFRLAAKDPNLDIRSLAEANRYEYAQFNPDNNPPLIIDSRGFIPKAPPRDCKENEIAGTPVSSGIIIGKVKLLSTPGEKPILPGDILVTRATDPGWTTLFINAGGVLLETGGPLQHGASVAREMGKPCIVGIENVTKILKNGQTVEMDGDSGRIRILNS